MTDLPVLRSRQASGIERRSVQGPSDALVEKAKMLAAAGSEVLPKGYSNKPGACLMALDWADRHDVSIFEVLAEVSMVYGKPVVSAKMQKRLAAREGCVTRVIDSSPTEATVAVLGPDGEERGRFTYGIELARGLGIAKGKNWDNDTEWMLTKRATTRALELYGPDELVSMFADDDEPDPAALPPAPEEPQQAAQAADDDVVDAEVVDAPEASGELSLEILLARMEERSIKQATALKAMREMYPETTALADLDGKGDELMDLADWIDQQ